MASRNFTALATYLAKGTINFDAAGDVFYALLVGAGETIDETSWDTWAYRDDVDTAAVEHPATGNYTTGGFLLSSVVNAETAVGDFVEIDIIPDVGNGNAVFTSATISAIGAIIFRQVGGTMATPATDELIAWVDFGGTVTSTNGDFNVTFSTPLTIDVSV